MYSLLHERHLIAKSSTTSGQLDIWLALVDLNSDVLPSQNGIFLTFQNFGPSTFLYLSVLQLGSEWLCNTVHVHGSYNLSI